MKPYFIRLYNLLRRIWRKLKNISFRVQSRVNSFNTELILAWRRLWQQPNIKGYLRDDQSQDQINLRYGWWLTDHILYLEGESRSGTFLGQQKITIANGKQQNAVRSVFFPLSDNQQAGLVFLEPSRTQMKKYWHLENDRSIAEDNGRNFVDYLETNREDRRLQIKNNLEETLFKYCPYSLRNELKIIFIRLSLVYARPSFQYFRPSFPFFFSVSEIIPAGKQGFLLIGWKYDPHNLLRSLTIKSHLNLSEDLNLDRLYPYHRPDVFPFLNQQGLTNIEDDYGFCAYISIPYSTNRRLTDTITLHQPCLTLNFKGDYTVTLNPLVKSSDPFVNRQVFVRLPHYIKENWDTVEYCLHPAAQALQDACNRLVAIKKITQYGLPIKKPIVSIIIPLYRQLDFLPTQLAIFGNDFDIKTRAEIIYILDSPEQQIEVENRLTHGNILYNLPIKLIVMNRNSGYSNSNNFGAQEARGKYLLLMNSDVLPIKDGWLKKMVDFYRSTPKIGALGPKLLYSDDTFQSAGIYFVPINPHYWLNATYQHGFPSNYPWQRESRPVPAVTGACLMIKRDIYNRLGGLSNEYIIGDFEDTDFCLKCVNAGFNNWYYADVSFYHFERQSMPFNNTYKTFAHDSNAYHHTKKWNSVIMKIMRKYEK